MDITITVTDEQLAIINKRLTTEAFIQDITNYANGMVNFHVFEGQKVLDEEATTLDQQRLEVLKADDALVAQVDAVIEASRVQIESPVEIIKEG